MLLNGVGYDVATAMHGIDALNKLRSTAPDLIVSDLHMPQMSGFEFLSVVRDRFPSIPVIAMSGDVHSDGEVPTGVMADAFYGKGRCRPNELLQMLSHLTRAPVARPVSPRDHPESKQEPRYRNDPNGAISVLPTCPNCLRSISFELTEEGRNGVQELSCESCSTKILYVSSYSPAAILESLSTATDACIVVDLGRAGSPELRQEMATRAPE